MPELAAQTRIAAHPIEPLFIDRWSSRQFGEEAIDDAVLRTVFEAARWAPSASNAQPWRFVVVKRGSEAWEGAVALLNERNQVWASAAAALIFVASSEVIEGPDGIRRSRSHSFDAGAAWAHLALQAHLLGWSTRAMGGFDRERALGELGAPADTRFEAAVAIGRRLPSAPVDEAAQPAPTQRRPITDFVFFDRFDQPAGSSHQRL